MSPGIADDNESQKFAVNTSPRRLKSWTLSCDKENVLPKGMPEKERRFSWMDDHSDGMLDEKGVFSMPDLHGSSNLRETSQGTGRSNCAMTSSIRHHKCKSRKQVDEGLSVNCECHAVTPHREGVDSNNGTLQSQLCCGTMFLNNHDAVGALMLPDDSCITTGSVVSDKFTGREELSFSDTCPHRHAHRPECEDSYSEMDYTFHSTGGDVSTSGSTFESCTSSLRRNMAASSETIAGQVTTSYGDDSNTSDVAADSTNFQFTFHTESSQVCIENDSDFRFTDCDRSSPILP